MICHVRNPARAGHGPNWTEAQLQGGFVVRIDSHQHFWRYNPAQHVWMTDEMAVLRRDFLPDDLAPLLLSVGFDATIVVQARQILEESDWLLALADRYD